MPSLKIPTNKQWSGIHRGKYTGSLWQTQNIDLETSPGRIRLSNKMRRFDTDGVIQKWVLTDADTTLRWYAITDNGSTGNLINTSNHNATGAYTDDSSSNSPTDPQDMIIHEGANGEDRLVVTRLTDIAILNRTGAANVWTADWWSNAGTLNQTNLESGYHALGRLERLLAVSDVVTLTAQKRAVLHTIDGSDVVSNTKITFPAGYSVRQIITTSDRFWISLTEDRFNVLQNTKGRALICEWDGTSSSYNFEYLLEGVSPLTGWVTNDIPYYITEIGYIYKFSGGGFQKVQEFPLEEDKQRFDPRFGNGMSVSQETGIQPYGSWVDKERVYINIGAPMRTAVLGTDVTQGSRRMRSGIWVYNTETNNLYHHMGLGQHNTSGTDIDYAGSPFSLPGAVMKSEEGTLRPVLLASARVFTGGATWLTTGQDSIYFEEFSESQASNEGRNRGYFITTYIPINEIEAMWQALWVKFRRFVNTTDNQIVVKWRTVDPLKDADASDESPLQVQGTWVNTTSFTAVVPTGVGVGDEAEILVGDNGGCLFNISALSATPDGMATITVTTSETAPTSSTDTMLVRFDNFRTEPAITSATVGNQRVPFTISTTANSGNNHGEFIQLKLYLIGNSIEIDELIPLYKNQTLIEQG